jgi:hypothetical protein
MKIRLIVPNWFHHPNDVPNAKRNSFPLETWGYRLATIAGGFTSTQGIGGYIRCDNGEYEMDDVTIFDVTLSADQIVTHLAAHREDIANTFRRIAHMIAGANFQESVYLEIDGKVEFVTA